MAHSSPIDTWFFYQNREYFRSNQGTEDDLLACYGVTTGVSVMKFGQ